MARLQVVAGIAIALRQIADWLLADLLLIGSEHQKPLKKQLAAFSKTLKAFAIKRPLR